MAEYIERESLAADGWYLQRHINGDGYACVQSMNILDVPAADVRPVVRCGECKLYGGRPWENGKTGICARTDFGVKDTDFCSYGARMDLGTDCTPVKDGDA